MSARAHSIFAPSASKRWINCPASIKMSENCPEQEDTPEALEGTGAHWLGETCLKTGKNTKDFFKMKMPSGARVGTNMCKHIQRYVDYVRKYHYVNGGTIHVEERLEMYKIDERMWGSGDVVQVTKYGTLHVFDLKYGFWVVEADANYQMMCYAIGALTKYKHLVDVSKGVCGHICQPRPEHKDGQFRSVLYSYDELVAFGRLAGAAIENSDSENPTIKFGDHCKFCPAEFICPELNQLGRKLFV